MIKKVLEVANVGVFRSLKARRDTEWRKLTLIHAENGRGKSTLCAILRSLKTNDSHLIGERKTLDSVDSQRVEILLDSGPVVFEDGAWKTPYSNIELFDSTFIAENVYSGDFITHDHKKNLCRVVLGKDGVQLAKAVDSLDEQIRLIGAEAKRAKDNIQALIPKDLAIDRFIGLTADKDIETKIADKKRAISVVLDAEQVRAKPKLLPIRMPQIPSTIEATLQQSTAGVSADAERLIQEHIKQHKMEFRGKAWLTEGLSYAGDGTCPFCAQVLSSSTIYDAVARVLDQKYRDVRQELVTLKATVEGALGDGNLLDLQRRLADNDTLAVYWEGHTKSSGPRLSFEAKIHVACRDLREALIPLIDSKLSSPLEPVSFSKSAIAARESWTALEGDVSRYNDSVSHFNGIIDQVKSSSGANIKTLETELMLLEMTRVRFEDASAALVAEYAAAILKKASLENDKTQAKNDLDAFTATMMEKYRGAVNKLLQRFGADFTLARLRVEYTGRTPRTAYTFGLLGKEVDPGTENTPSGMACFRNTLSAGDRSSLALALFIAQLNERDDVGDLVIVFDDPFTSLDSLRQLWTSNRIRKLGEKSKQTVVLSHSLKFLEQLVSGADAASVRTLEIDRYQPVALVVDSRIVPLDMEEALRSTLEADLIQLRNYHQGEDKDALKTIRVIRPLLENMIRRQVEEECPAKTGWLGSFLPLIRTADPASKTAALKPIEEDLDALNTYTKSYMHDSADASSIIPGELLVQVQLTLQLLGRL